MEIEKGKPLPSSVKKELEQIRLANDGILRPADVVEFAKNHNSALHRHFEWDDTEAAKQYRLVQARGLISVVVQRLPGPDKEQVRVYASLSTERGEGYRHIVDILNDDDLREKLLEDALKELRAFQKKYQRLKDAASLGPIFEAIEKSAQA